MVFTWLTVSLAFLLLELGHPGLFFFLSFSIGALVSSASTLLDASVSAQVVTFFVGSAASFIILSQWVKKTSAPAPRTNVYALQGKRGIVTAVVSGIESGSVKIGGEIWKARAAHENEIIEIGAAVEIITVRGVHVIVKKVTNT